MLSKIAEAFEDELFKLAARKRHPAHDDSPEAEKRREHSLVPGAVAASAALTGLAGKGYLMTLKPKYDNPDNLRSDAAQLHPQLPRGTAVNFTPTTPSASAYGHDDTGAHILAGNRSTLAHEMAHDDFWSRLGLGTGGRKTTAAMYLRNAILPTGGALIGKGMSELADPAGSAIRYSWLPSAIGSIPMLADEAQANIRGYLAERRAFGKAPILPYLGSMGAYLGVAALPAAIVQWKANQRIREYQERQDAAAKKKYDKLQKRIQQETDA